MDKQLSKRDLLSDLPLGIIHIVLSFVPIKDAIRTSILSRKWRYIWASLPHLAFDYDCVNPPIKKRLIHFISQTLLLHQGPIHTFELRLPHVSMGEHHCIAQWLLFLSRNDIRILLLEIDDVDSEFQIHSSLYSCQNLIVLKLHFYTIPPPPPSFKGFLCLQSLYICLDEVSTATIEIIVALSLLLEKFTLKSYADPDMKINICAPNLKYFHFRSLHDHLSLCTPLLEEFVGDFSRTKYFSIGNQSLFFRHLKTIKLFSVPFHVNKVIMAVIRLITGSPHLQKLEIASYPARWTREASSWDIESMPNFTIDCLKVIKMENFYGRINEMKLIKLLLARSPVLEKMMFEPPRSLPDLELLKLTARLLTYRRASASAEIVIVGHPVSSSLQL